MVFYTPFYTPLARDGRQQGKIVGCRGSFATGSFSLTSLIKQIIKCVGRDQSTAK